MGHVKWLASGRVQTGDGILWGEVAISPNGSFALLTLDAYSIGQDGLGRYRLVEREARLRCDGRLERPNGGKVANDGTFALADRQFGDGLRCRFLVMTADGRPVIDEALGANALRVDISDDGRYAAIHLASNSEAPEFNELFTVYDVMRGLKLWSKPLECGRAESAMFDPDRGLVHVGTKTYGSFDFGLVDGTTDEWAIHEAILARGNGFEIIGLVREELAPVRLAPTRARRLVADCERASAMLGEYPGHAARALRLAGEILEAQGDREGALALWDRALAADPKVGIRRRADALRAGIRRNQGHAG